MSTPSNESFRPPEIRSPEARSPETWPRIASLDHVQLAIPAGGEDRAREFWTGLFGFAEEPRPESMRSRGGLWLRTGSVSLHIGVEAEFRPARKAHPAFRVHDLATLCEALRSSGHEVRPDTELAGVERAFVDDPFGNRVELIQD